MMSKRAKKYLILRENYHFLKYIREHVTLGPRDLVHDWTKTGLLEGQGFPRYFGESTVSNFLRALPEIHYLDMTNINITV